MALSMNLNNTVGTSTSQPLLKPWEIHDVLFKGITYNEFTGKKDPNAVYQVMKVRFENEKGYYEETIFCPKEGDEVRRVNKVKDSTTGNEVDREQISNFENFQLFVAHLGEQLCPTNYEKIKGKGYNFPEDFKMFVEILSNALKPALNKTTKLKLIAGKDGQARLPYYGSLDKNGEKKMVNNFLGEKVFLSKYEMETMEKQKAAKPTNMPVGATDDLGGDDLNDVTDDDLNFEV